MRDGKYVVAHVDDSLLAREMVREALEAVGFEVHNAEHAQDFEQRLMADEHLRQIVDFIVLDMEMPDLTGAQVGGVMDTVYEELENVPFMIYSGKDKLWVETMALEVAEYSRGFQRNYRGYMGKSPEGADKLAARVKEILAELETKNEEGVE